MGTQQDGSDEWSVQVAQDCCKTYYVEKWPRCWQSLYDIIIIITFIIIIIIIIITILIIIILSAQWTHLIGSPGAEAGPHLSRVITVTHNIKTLLRTLIHATLTRSCDVSSTLIVSRQHAVSQNSEPPRPCIPPWETPRSVIKLAAVSGCSAKRKRLCSRKLSPWTSARWRCLYFCPRCAACWRCCLLKVRQLCFTSSCALCGSAAVLV